MKAANNAAIPADAVAFFSISCIGSRMADVKDIMNIINSKI
jgi:hypothetical protein